MKILIATESYYPTISGVSVFSRYLSLGLAKRGHEVHVICPSPILKSYTEHDHGVVLHRIRGRKNPFRENHRNSFMARPLIKHLFSTIKPDVVHLQDPLPTSRAVLKAAKVAQVPCVVTNHFSFDYVLSYLPLLKPLHPQLSKYLEGYLLKFYNQCDFITFPSETIQNQFKHLDLTSPSLAISNGVDLEQFFPSFNYEELRIHFGIPKKKTVLHVGRLDQDKKPFTMLKAFGLVRKELDAHFVICGEGNKKEALIDLAESLNIQKHITFIGFIDHKIELPQMYQMADVFVTGSEIETQGIVVLEAMASELPVVVANAGALPELVEDGVNGYLCRPGDEIDMAKKLLKILQDPPLAAKMGQHSLEMVEEHQIERSFDKFEHIYNQVVTHAHS